MHKANTLIEAECRKNEPLSYVDITKPMFGEGCKPRTELFLADGLHLNAKGYELWTAVLRPHLK